MKPYATGRGWTLYHGDCREVLPTLSGVDAVVTDPPFGIGFAAQPTKWQRMAGKKPEAWDRAEEDTALFAQAEAEHKQLELGDPS